MKIFRLLSSLFAVCVFTVRSLGLTVAPNDVSIPAGGASVEARMYDEVAKTYTSNWWVGIVVVSVGSSRSEDQSWLRIRRDVWDGSILLIDVAPNYLNKQRTASVEIQWPDQREMRSVYIRQAAGFAAVLPGVVEIPGEGGVETVEIKGAKAASFSAPAWVKVSSLDLGARLRVEVARNPAAQERQGTVTIQTDVLGAVPLTLALTQAPAPVAEPPAGPGFTYDAGNGWIYHYNTRTWTYHPPHWAWDSAAGWFVR